MQQWVRFSGQSLKKFKDSFVYFVKYGFVFQKDKRVRGFEDAQNDEDSPAVKDS